MRPLRRSALREIRASLGRYLAILAIVALGVGFFCGLRVCRDAMVSTGDDYLNRQNMYDYRLISTVGFSTDDESHFAALDGVTAAEGSISQDALVESTYRDVSGVIKFHSLTGRVNAFSLVAGRLPQNGDEVVADAVRFGVDSIGSTLRLSDLNDEDTLDMFAYRKYTIVGVGNSPTYMNYERGSTSLGNGTVQAFAYLPREGFTCDYFTEIYVRLRAEGAIYSDEYENGVARYEEEVTDSGEERARARFEKIIRDAEEELQEGEDEYAKAYAEYQEKRADAERELQEALDELEEGESEIADNERKLEEGESELADARAQYDKGEDKLVASRRKLKKAKKSAYAQIGAAKEELETQLAAAREGMAQIEASGVLGQYEQLTQSAAQLEAGVTQAEDARRQLTGAGDMLRAGIAEAQANVEALTAQKNQALADARARRETLEGEIAALQSELDALDPGDDARIAELNARLAGDRAEKQRLEGEISSVGADYDSRISAAESRKSALETQAGQAASTLSNLQTQRDRDVAALESDIAGVAADIAARQATLSGLDPETDAERIAALQGEISALNSRKAALESDLAATKSDYAGRIAAAEAEKASLDGQVSQAESDLAQLREQRQTALAALESALTGINADIAAAEQELAGLVPSPDAQRRAEIESALAAKRQSLAALDEEISRTSADYGARIRAAQTAQAELEAQLAAHEASYDANLAEIDAQLQSLNAQLAQVRGGLAQIEAAGYVGQYAQLRDGVSQIEAGLAQVEEKRAQADGRFADARRQISNGKSKLADARVRIQEAEQELEDGRAQLEDARVELKDGRAEYEDARADADAEFSDAERELADARAEIAEAREKIADIEEPDVYVLDRTANIGYVCFKSDSQIVQGISNVFPLFFFMVAALVCMTTMTRMVDEQRTQIGVLKAVGYSPRAIMGKFVFYAGSAATIGGVLGFFGGSALFPKVIWKAYDIMYGFSDIELVFNWGLGAASLAAALLCSVGATWSSVRRELGVTPANLLRPAAPKAGKRIFLERVKPLWRRLSFMQKLRARNIFRYKKRLVMMIIGIGGCTALLVTGLGIRDSISDVVNYQYDEITLYDIAVTFTAARDEAAQEAFRRESATAVEDCLFVHEGSADVSANGVTKSIYVVATDADDISKFVGMHAGGEAVSLPGAGEAVISLGLSEALNVGVGGQITVRDSDLREMRLTVSGVFENYIYNYVYVRADTCKNLWGYAPDVKSAYVNVPEGADVHEAAALLSGLDGVGNVSANLDLCDRVNSMMENLDYIVMMVVFSAGALAFIVLYNLTNINITERTREIATVKVLGFYPKETAAYVFSENLLLCLLSALAGLPLGKCLHAFVISQIKIDMIRFDVRVAPLSYLLAIALTFAFAFLVNLVLRPKLEKINMAESLKTVE